MLIACGFGGTLLTIQIIIKWKARKLKFVCLTYIDLLKPFSISSSISSSSSAWTLRHLECYWGIENGACYICIDLWVKGRLIYLCEYKR